VAQFTITVRSILPCKKSLTLSDLQKEKELVNSEEMPSTLVFGVAKSDAGKCFEEDASTVRKDNAPENLTLIKKIGLNRFRMEVTDTVKSQPATQAQTRRLG